MEMRVEQLSARSGMSVDTIRYYQSKGLLEPPRRQGRVAWYHDGHVDRLERIRSLQHKGFTLATIARLVSGDLDAADEALLSEISGLNEPGGGTGSPGHNPADGPESPAGGTGRVDQGEKVFTIEELATATGVPLALLKAVEAEGLLIPRRIGGQERYTAEDVAAAHAGLLLLEWGIPLSALLDLARRHHEATEAVAHDAVNLFSTYVRRPLRGGHPPTGGGPGGAPPDADVERLVRAYSELLPAVNTLVANHFTRTLVNTALDHVERSGSDAERRAISDQIGGIGTGELVEAGVPTSAPRR
ncbi:MAG: MerR family transcriptional regulator [Acidimicrobiales bacterium]|jgi:DNA-binding transcriptional MerR regulator